ncbi:MAG: tetratricopeptide repeat protein, partial [Saprospiraceae bacterium]
MKYFIVILGLLITTQTVLTAQDPRLCEQYFRNGEYDKASLCFQKIFQKNPTRDYYFDRYVETLMLSEQYNRCEKELKKRIKKYPQKVKLYVDYGAMLERQFKQEKANKQYKRAIDNLPKNRTEIIRLSQKFIKLTKYDLALESYKKGSELLADKKIFAYELGDLYRQKGDRQPMIENYIISLKATPTRLNSLKTIFQRFFGADDFKELQLQLYQAINDTPDEMVLLEMMSWVFIQKKDYKNAFRQVKAIDKRTKDTGGRVYRLAQMAQRAKDYDAAIKAYEYLIEEKGRTNTYYIDSKKEMLKCKRLRLVDGYDYTQEDLKTLEAEYETFLTEFGKNATSGNIVYELAELEAFFLNDLDKAIELMEELIETPGVRRHLLAESKIALGDYYLMDGEIWESTLLYSQVDKAYKDDVLGQKARFKNAKLSYFKGDYYLMDGEIWESTLLYSQVDKAYKDDVLGQKA